MDNEPTIPQDDLDRLRQSPVPPEQMESRVVRVLETEGLLRTSRARPPLQLIAAAVVIFAAGALAGRFAWPNSSIAPEPSSARQRFMLLLAGDETPSPDGSSRAAEYGQWAREIGATGTRITGEELGGQSAMVRPRSRAEFPELASVGGYFLIDADNLESAVAIARSSPHVRYGGSVVVRTVK